jgi:hypothetical protein
MAYHPRDHVANLHSNDKLFVPAPLELKVVVAKRERRLQWSVKFGVQAIYIGQRLQCQNEDVMALTP